MENKINLAAILKDCPRGMELDCSIHTRPVIFNCVKMESDYPIRISSKDGFSHSLTYWGSLYNCEDAKCIIFPKGKTTWEGFVPPYKFKEGDVVISNRGDIHLLRTENSSYCAYRYDLKTKLDYFITTNIKVVRLATEEEKSKLFQAIKDNGYQWNTETKTLEKLVEPQFNVGDWIIRNNKYTGIPVKVIEFNGYYSCELNGEIVNLTRNDVHNNFHLWTIDDAKDGDVLFHSDSASNGIFIFKEILQRGTLQKVICYCDYDSEDGFCLGENHTCCWADSKILYPATKERCDILFQKMKEAGYKWNVETKTLEKLVNMEDKGNISDGYHTFNELYEYRLLYNASMFNELAKQGLYDVHKSKKHSDGTTPFGDENWFIVQAELPTGQISNHYEMKDWDLFQIPEKERANTWDGHTPQDVYERLVKYLNNKLN